MIEQLTEVELMLLINGYLRGQFREWLTLKAECNRRLGRNADCLAIDNLVYGSIPFLLNPLYLYAKKEINQEKLNQFIGQSVQAIMAFTLIPDKKETNIQELLLMHIRKIFLDFESPNEFRGVLKDGYETASEMNLPLCEAFKTVPHYNNFVRKRYKPLAFAQKLKILLSMLDPKRLEKEYGLKPNPNGLILELYMAEKLVINDRIQQVFSPRRA